MFGEMLDELMTRHNVKAVDLCRMLEMSKSYFSKMKSGAVLPSDYGIVDSLAAAMMLSSSEKSALGKAYKNTKFGSSYRLIDEAVERVYCIEQLDSRPPETTEAALKNGHLIRGRDVFIRTLKIVLSQSEKSVFIKYVPDNSDISQLVQDAVASAGKNAEIQWLTYLYSCNGASPENVHVFSNIVPVLLARKVDMRYSYLNVDDYYSSSMFPFIFATEKEALIADRNCSNAVYFNDCSTTEQITRHFCTSFQSASKLAMTFFNFMDFLYDYELMFGSEKNNCELYIVEKNPCIIHEADYSDIKMHTRNIEGKDFLVDMYVEFLRRYTTAARKQHIIFSESGMREFFESDEYYEYGKIISKSLSKPLRYNCFKKLLGFSEAADFLAPGIIHVPFFDNSKIHCMNIWSDGKLLLWFAFENSFRIVLMNEKSIVSSFIEYFKSLTECGLIASKKDTLEIMKKEMKRYLGKQMN